MVKKMIYCIEGLYLYQGETLRAQEPSIQPLLEYLQRNELCNHLRRSCSTIGELRSLLRNEWDYLEKGSILYISCHGSPGCLDFCEDEPVTLDQLGKYTNLSGCMVHFGSCDVLSISKGTVNKFMEATGATIVSGYQKEVSWTNTFDKPSGALELMLLSTIAEEKINIALQKNSTLHREKLYKLTGSLQKRFPDCGFVMYIN